MTQEFRCLLQLTGAAALGTAAAEPDVSVDWMAVYRLAQQHQVQHLLAYTLRESPDLTCPANIREKLKKELRSAASINYLRTYGMLQLMEEMRAAGMRPVLLKGSSLAPYYAARECRISTDTDIWIAPADEMRAYALLREKGFRVNERGKTGHHAFCQHAELGILELHTLLYDEIVEEIWFGKKDGSEFIREDFVRIDTEDGSYEVLGYTDYLLFLTLHLVKHFIISGMSIRMLLDVALFWSKNRERIDWLRYWAVVDRLQYRKLVYCVLSIAVRYCGFDAGDFPGLKSVPEEQILQVVDDLEQGGWLGENDKEHRNDGKREYNRYLLMKDKSWLEYRLFMLGWEYGNIRLLFPSRTSMIEKYPYLKEKPWLMPAAWLHRLVVRGGSAIRRGALKSKWAAGSKEMSDAGSRRIELFRQLGMMK